jgi:hypothetical protein
MALISPICPLPYAALAFVDTARALMFAVRQVA